MEQAAPDGNSETADVGHCKDGVMAIGRATFVPFVRQVHEQGIGDGIDNLCRVDGGIVILQRPESALLCASAAKAYPKIRWEGGKCNLFAEIEGRCLGSPDAFTGRRIRHRWQCEAHLSSGRC